MRVYFRLIVLAALSIGCAPAAAKSDFIKTSGLNFMRGGKKYAFIGTNFWYGMNLGAYDRPRLRRELDRLKRIGIRNLRIFAATEGPDTEPWRIVPALQTAPGIFSEKLLVGLDFLLAEMRKRDLTAVIVLGNYWQWSGGFGQYLNWAGNGAIPYPEFDPTARGGSDSNAISFWRWLRYNTYVTSFYSNLTAIGHYENTIRKIVSRRNTITGTQYANDPTIMAWQLANEPAGFWNSANFDRWIGKTARLIKSLDPNHLVSSGAMGEVFSLSGIDHVRNNSHPEIDYATLHIWVQNSGLYDPLKPESTYPKAVANLSGLIATHRGYARRLGKPLVLEEFGFSRDQNRFAAGTPVRMRDAFFGLTFKNVIDSQQSDTPIAGVNFWAWAGEGVPAHVKWQAGDPFVGDPPHEAQGWYSVYAGDKSTLAVIAEAAKKIAAQNP